MPRRSAFTLLELMLVLALVVMVLAVSYPALDAFVADARLKAGADHLRAKFAEARMHAIDENRPYRFGVKPGESGYRLAPDTADYWGDAADMPSDPSANGAGEGTVLEDAMPSNIRFDVDAGATSSDGYVSILTFLPDGSCSEDKAIRIELDGARPIEILVRGLTGSVSVRAVRQEDR